MKYFEKFSKLDVSMVSTQLLSLHFFFHHQCSINLWKKLVLQQYNIIVEEIEEKYLRV